MGDNVHDAPPRRRRWWHIHDVQQDVRHLNINYDVRERETQIQKIVDDHGFNWTIFFVAASGFLASSYSLFATNVMMPSLYYVYPPCGRLNNNTSEVIDLLTLIGVVLGMVIMGHWADRAGRKKLYGQELLIIIVATMGVVQASEGFISIKEDGTYDHSMDIYSWIPWWRFALGFGIGAEYPMSAIITAEWAPTQSRGTMLASVFAMQSLGRMLAFATSLGAVRDSSLSSYITGSPDSKLVVDRAWRLVIGVGVIPAALAIWLRTNIPETPRYHADIMKDLRKAVRNALKIYGRNTRVTILNPIIGPARQNSNGENDHWFRGAGNYLFGPPKAWRNLAMISFLWGIMDVAWYGLSLDSPSAFSTLVHNLSGASSPLSARSSASGACTDTGLWNTDPWEPSKTIDKMLIDNSLRSIYIVSIASLAGSAASILIVNRFRRSSILVATFLLLSILFAVGGGSLIGTYRADKSHLVATVFYAIVQFVFNLGPNTLIFVLAAEIFPTVYRGTFYGIAAASGKVGAIVIRAIVQATGNREMAIGIRLLVFIPLMLLSALISYHLPEVQHVPVVSEMEDGMEMRAQNGAKPTETVVVSGVLTHPEEVAPRRSRYFRGVVHFPRRIRNKTLEEIAPNPSWDSAAAVT